MNLYELAASIGIEGFLHCDELHKLVQLAANRDVLEIGSFKGLSAWGMAISAKSLCCVDTFCADPVGQRQMPAFTTLDAFKNAVSRYANVTIVVGQSDEVQVPGDFDMVFL